MPTPYEIRVSKDLTQAYVAEKAGLSIATISRMENGQRITKDNLKKVCQVLEVSIEDVTGVNVYSAVQSAAKRKKARV
jgi:transcriptional regulator with XRE-family HTH domain